MAQGHKRTVLGMIPIQRNELFNIFIFFALVKSQIVALTSTTRTDSKIWWNLGEGSVLIEMECPNTAYSVICGIKSVAKQNRISGILTIFK